MAKKVTITYKGNGGKGSTYKQKVVPDTAIKLKANKFKRPGYVFLGWSATRAGKKKYSTNRKVKIKSKLTLYAIWKKIPLSEGAKKVYTKVYKSKVPHKHYKNRKLAKRFENIKKGYAVTCNSTASMSLQQIGCLKSNQVVGHTKHSSRKRGSKISTYMYNSSLLRNCNIYYVNKKFSKLPKKYKPKSGAVYIYDSNAAVYSGDGKHIWSCNNDIYYTTKGSVFKKSGYCFTSPIKLVILPR